MVWYKFTISGRIVGVRHNTSTHRYKVFIDHVEVKDVPKSVGESIVEVLRMLSDKYEVFRERKYRRKK